MFYPDIFHIVAKNLNIKKMGRLLFMAFVALVIVVVILIVSKMLPEKKSEEENQADFMNEIEGVAKKNEDIAAKNREIDRLNGRVTS